VAGEQGITEIKIDGREDPDILTSDQDRPLPQNIRVIELVTKDAMAITREGFEKIKALLHQINQEINDLEESEDNDLSEKATGKCREILEGSRPIINFINSVGMNFNLDFDSIKFNRQISIKGKINRYLKQLQKALSIQQPASSCDLIALLQGPIKKELSDWDRICDILLETIKPGKT
jgi:hypothetical protein